MRQLSIAVIFFCSIAMIVSCEKNNDNNNSNGYDFSSIRVFDVNANALGTVGDASDDYTQEEWPQWVQDLFIPLDTTNLTGYIQSHCSIDALFPNPCADTQMLRLFATQPVNLKVVVIDKYKNVYFRQSIHVPSAQHTLLFRYDSTMVGGTNYRMFYGFSAENKPMFMRGHIDIQKL